MRTALAELLLDRRDDAGVGRFDLGGEACGDEAVAADQVFVEIPPRPVERALRRRPFVERVLGGAVDDSLGGDREARAVMLLRGRGDRGLLIVGVPSNDFGGQEPGSSVDIAETAQHHYGATFPITAKAEVRGPNSHPFYKWAVGQRPLDPPRWNFHKYLIGRDGLIAASFASEVEPTDPRVIAAIEKQLG